MKKEEYNKQAVELAEILLENYDTHKHDRTYSLWSFAFFWNGSKLGEYSTTNPYYNFIEETFRISTEEAKKPEGLVPRATSTVAHFSMLSMTNRDLIEKVYSEAISSSVYARKDDAMCIVSDKKIIEEMLDNYITEKEKKLLNEKTDIFNFLLRYDITKRKIIETQKPQGTYLSLATRLIYRYGEEGLEDGIFSIVNNKISERAKSLHCSALLLDKEPPIEEDLLLLYSKYANGNSPIIRKPDLATKVHIPGPRRVKTNGININVDWSAIEISRKRKILSYQAFNPKEIIKSRIERAITESYLNLYKEHQLSCHNILAEINDKIAAVSPAEKEVLIKVRRKFEIMGKFSDFDIKHRMPVTIIRQGE